MKHLFTLLLLSLVGYLCYTHTVLLKQNYVSISQYEILEYQSKLKDTAIMGAANSVVRLEILFGVDSPNGVLNVKEKFLTGGRNISKINKADLRKTK